MEVKFIAKDKDQFFAEKRKAMLKVMTALENEARVCVVVLPKTSDYDHYILKADV